MKKQLFATVFCGVLLLMVGLLWWRVRELEKAVNSLRIQPATNSTVVWQTEQQSKNSSPKKQVFKLIDSSEVVNPGKTEVGVPWNVERAMMGDRKRQMAPLEEWKTPSEVQSSPEHKLLPDQPASK